MADDVSAYKGCKKLAQDAGALADTGLGCAPVFGKRIEIGPDKHSIQEGAEITNFNMHVKSNSLPLPSPEFDLGPVDGFFSGV